MKPVQGTAKTLVAARRAADSAEAVRNEARALFLRSGASEDRKHYRAANNGWPQKRRSVAEQTLNLFLKRVGSLVDSENYEPRFSGGWFV